MTQKLTASTQPITAATAEKWKEAESASAAAIEALFESSDSLGALKGLIWDARGDGFAALDWDHELSRSSPT